MNKLAQVDGVALRALDPQGDVPLLERWLRSPHVVQWWGTPDPHLTALGQRSMDTHALITADGRPVGYLCWQRPSRKELEAAELARMKELYRRFAPRGVEFIGISLDEPEEKGGRQALRVFLKKHEVAWPHYYQGQGYESAFSMSWGVGSVPTLFVLDRQGRLYETPSAAQLGEAIAALLQTKGR